MTAKAGYVKNIKKLLTTNLRMPHFGKERILNETR